MIKVGSDFSGVGAFDQALMKLGIDYETVFACDMDKYARKTFIANYGEPMYYPENVYNRKIPAESLDIYMTSPPCQAFSLAGKRKGEEDDRGVLFYNSHEFIKVNKPRFFIFENVKGLLSDDSGKTFQRWIDFLGGKSVNGNPVLFPHDESVPYHVYHKVLNAKDFGVPQNRERVFIIGIRDDQDNIFSWPREIPLEKRLRDVLESEVDEKYYLSEKMVEDITFNGAKKGEIANLNKGGERGSVYSEDSDYMTCLSATDFKQPKQIAMKSATSKSYEIAEVGEDSINLEHPNSETIRGRVGKGVAQTLTTSCNQGVAVIGFERTEEAKEKRSKSIKEKGIDTGKFSDRKLKLKQQDYSDTILANPNHQKEGLIAEFKIGAIRGRNPDNPTSRKSGEPTQQMLEINESGVSNCLTTVQKDNVVVVGNLPGKHEQNSRIYGANGVSPTLTTMQGGGQEPKISTDYRIRKLTPLECLRLMAFPDTLVENARKAGVSDSQLYKQAGNSIVVDVLAAIINKLNLKQ